METILYGAASFIITGLDDLIVLILLWVLYPKKFGSTVLGTSVGLMIINFAAILFGALLLALGLIDIIPTNLVIAAVLVWVAIWLFRDVWRSENDINVDAEIIERNSVGVFFLSAKIYIINGLDDFALYSSFYTIFTEKDQIISFSIGLFLGLFFFILLVFLLNLLLGERIINLEKKAHNKIKLVVASLLVLVALYLIF